MEVSQLSSLAKRGLVGRAVIVLAAGFAIAPLGGASAPPAGAKDAPAPAAGRFGLGNHTWKVTTDGAAAQRAFDRGLTLAYGFSHGAAELEFRKAAEADPACAMAWWGVALVNGPHINLPTVSEARARTAWDALQRARQLSGKAGAEERALIDALGARYADPQPADRKPLDEAYAAAMREVWKAYPKDADVATLFAEAMMDLRPWDLWTKDGRPQPGTEEILRTLEAAMRIDPNHPGANHYYIHAVEGSPEPGKALVQADRLAALAPGASHLVHMPAHIYARVGRWPDASSANVDAIAADAAYRAANPKPGFFAMYIAHDHHFFAYAETAQGHGAAAIGAARKMVAEMPPEFFRDFGPFADFYTAFVPEILMRFGKWEEILKEPEPAGDLPLSRAFWRETRGVALTALGRLEEANSERRAFREAAARIPEGYPCGNNTAKDVMAIASGLLDGEIAAKAGRLEEAERLLREAVRAEDGLAYDEPPDWMQPVRHTLGAVLLRDGKFAEAETVYREDLAVEPNNGWGLYGLARACRLQKKEAEAADAEARFSRVWRGADVKLKATCLCQPPT